MRVAAYLRVSTEEQAEQNISIPAQKSRIIAYCHSKVWNVSDFYVDDGFSGKNLDRPEMQRLLTDCAEGKVDAVGVWKLDRLSRRMKDALYLIEDVLGLGEDKSQNKIDLVSVTENLDTTTPMGRAMLSIIFVFSQLERETIIERSRMGKKEAARQGRWGGGGLPYGYNFNDDGKLVINPIQAEAVKEIYSLYLTGQYGFKTIADIMTQKGFAGQRTKEMQKDQVKNVLNSPFPAGLVKHLDSVYPGQHEAIIDMPQWEKVQSMINDRYTPIPVKVETNLLTGLIWCGKCGARMRFKSREWKSANATGKNYYYICYGRAGFKTMAPEYCRSPFHHAANINSQVIKKLHEYSLNIDEAREMINKAFKPVDNSPSLSAIQTEIKGIESKIERWETAYENGDIAADIMTGRINTLTTRKKALDASVRKLQKESEQIDERREHAEGVLNMLADLPEYWEKLTQEEKRGLIFNMVKKITVQEDGKVNVELDL